MYLAPPPPLLCIPGHVDNLFDPPLAPETTEEDCERATVSSSDGARAMSGQAGGSCRASRREGIKS